MDEELRRKIKETKSLHEKYVQMLDEHMAKENITDDDFNRSILSIIKS